MVPTWKGWERSPFFYNHGVRAGDLAHKESQREDQGGPCWLFAEEKMGMAFTRHQVDQGLENEGE